MSDSNPQEQNRETETKTFLDLKLNPNFATNQQTDNLEKLKKSVHHLLSSKFSNLNFGDSESRILDTKDCRSSLKNYLNQLKNPTKTVFFNSDMQIIDFDFNVSHKMLFFLDQKNQIYFATERKIPKNDGSNEFQQKVEFLEWRKEFFDFEEEKCGKIWKIMIDNNDLFVFSENKLVKFLIAGWNKIIKPKVIFRFDKIKEIRDLPIQQVLHFPSHDLFYIITERNKKKKKILLRFSPNDEKLKLIKEVGLNGHSFQVNPEEPDLVYFIEESVAYSLDLTGNTSGASSGFFSGFGFGQKNEGKELFGAVEFFQGTKNLTVLQFDSSFEHFFCNDDKILKKYHSESKEVVAIFDDVTARTKKIILDEKKNRLFSFDSSGQIKIWNLETQRLITKLRKQESSKLYLSQKLFDRNQLAISLHTNGIDFWTLSQPHQTFSIQEDDSKPKFIIIPEKNWLVANFSNQNIYIFHLSSLELLQIIPLPEKTLFTEFLANGDLHLVYENPEFDQKRFARDIKLANAFKSKLPQIVESKDIANHKIKVVDADEDQISQDFETGAVNELNISDDPSISRPGTLTVSQVNLLTASKFNTNEKEDKIPSKTNLKYMNLSQRDKPKDGKIEANFRDDTELEQLKSRTELPDEGEDIKDIDKIPLQNQPSLIERVGQTFEPQVIDKKRFRYYLVRVVLEDYDLAKPDENWFYLFQTNFKIVSLHSDFAEYDSQKAKSSSNEAGNNGTNEKNGGNEDNKQDQEPEIEPLDGLDVLNAKYVYETALFLENQTLQRISYHTTASCIPIQDKIFFEKVLDSKKLNQKGTVFSHQVSMEGSIASSKANYGLESNLSASNPISACIHAESQTILALMLAPRPKDFNLDGNDDDSTQQKNKSNNDTASTSTRQANTNKSKQFVLNVFCQHKSQKLQTMTIDLQPYPDFTESGPLILKPGKRPNLNGNSTLSYYLYSQAYLASFEFNPSTRTFNYFKILKRKAASNTPPNFSADRELFFIPVNNSLQVWDDQLQFLLETLHTEKSIESIVMNDSKDALFLFDLYSTYHFDLDTFQLMRKLQAYNPTKNTFFLPLQFNLLPHNLSFTTAFNRFGAKRIALAPKREPINLIDFPFEHLKNCYDKKNYADPIKDFSKYYFKRLNEWGRQDYELGPLSPLMMCVFHFDSALLEEILGQYYYPTKTHGYVSPLEFAFTAGHKASIIYLCTVLTSRREDNIFYSREDFKFLLVSQIPKAHNVISTMLVDPPSTIIPKVIYMQNPVESKSTKYVTSLGVSIRRRDLAQDAKNEKIFQKDMDQKNKSKKISAKFIDSSSGSKSQSKSEVKILTTPFKYNYDMGTDDSVMFVERYAYSSSDDFVLSDWKQIIIKKWKNLFLPYFMIFVLYLLYTIFISLNFVFLNDNDAVYWIAISLNLFFLLYEFTQCVVYISYKPTLYIFDLYTWIDWVVGVGCLLYQFILHDTPDKESSRIISILLLIFLYYRLFSFLRILDSFTTLVGMINTILKELWVFFVILGFSFLAFSILMIRLDNETSRSQTLTNIFVYIVLGGAEGDSFEVKFSHVAIIVGAIFVTIVLMNILIAYLSNLFSRLEDAQKLNDLKEKAVLILDLEIIVMFFKYKIRGALGLRMKQDIMKSQQGGQALDWKKNFKPKQVKTLQKYLRNEKFFFIFKATDLGTDEDGQNENVYQKIKNLEKATEDISNLIHFKNRTLQKSIESVKDTFKKLNSNQSSALDDLKEAISGNSKEILENTENLIYSVEENDKKTVEKIDQLLGLNEKVNGIEKQIGFLNDILSSLGNQR